MRWCAVALVGLLGCSGRNGGAADHPPPEDPRRQTEPQRCTMDDLPGSLAGGASVAVARGPRRPLLLRAVENDDPTLPSRPLEVAWRWSDGEHAGAVYTVTSGDSLPVLAWTGAGFLVHRRAGLELRDPTLETPRPLRGVLPPGACGVHLAELPEGAVVTWRTDCDRTRGGLGQVLFLGPNGELRQRPRVLGDALAVRLTSLTARWDFGRVVVTALDAETVLPQWWIFDAGGALLASDTGAQVACPRSGCVRVRAAGENGGGEVPEEAMLLRVDPLRGGVGFTTNISARDVRAVAVSGDRVLSLRSPVAGTGCDLAVVDVARRLVLADRHEDGLACTEGSVRATPRGFALALGGPPRPMLRLVDCAR